MKILHFLKKFFITFILNQLFVSHLFIRQKPVHFSRSPGESARFGCFFIHITGFLFHFQRHLKSIRA